MPRPCKICTHEQSSEIDKAIAQATSYRNIAKQFGVSEAGVSRHVATCIPLALNSLRQERQQKRAIGIEDEIDRVFRKLNKLLEACDRWLTDPDDPELYTLDCRDNELDVIYLDYGDLTGEGNPKRKRAQLSALLAMIRGEGKAEAVKIYSKQADPRDLIVKTAAEIKGQLELIGRLRGLFQRDRENEADVRRRQQQAQENRKWAEGLLRAKVDELGNENKARNWLREQVPTAWQFLTTSDLTQ